MNRTEPRMHWVKRVVATATIVGALGVGAATALPAGASESNHSCDGLSTASNSGQGWHAFGPGQAWHACNIA